MEVNASLGSKAAYDTAVGQLVDCFQHSSRSNYIISPFDGHSTSSSTTTGGRFLPSSYLEIACQQQVG